MTKSLSEIKAEEGRDLDSQINENTLIPAENEVGTFGVCKAFEVEKAFVKAAEEKTVAVADALAVVNADGTLSKETIASVFNHKNSLQETISGKKTFSGGIEGNVNGNINSESSTIEELNGGVPITTAAQTLTEEQKAQVRNNIGANSILDDVVKFTPQTLTDEQKAQARENIGVKEGGGEGSSAPIGSIMMWFSPNSPAGWVFCNHTKLAISDYAELYEKVKDIPQCQSEEEGFFYTPDFRDRVPQGANGNLGQLIEAGLPNITGFFDFTTSTGVSANLAGNNSVLNGALYKYNPSKKRVVTVSDNTYDGSGIGIDASLSNSIYGNSDTVQPPANACNFIIKALNVTESLDESVKVDDNKTTTGNVWSASKVMEEIGKFDGKIEEVDNKNNYSTEETVVGTWIDGKPIYRKVFNFTLTQFSDTTARDLTINNEIKRVIDSELIGYDNANKTICVNSRASTRINSSTSITVKNSGLAGYYEQLIMTYTKTTD